MDRFFCLVRALPICLLLSGVCLPAMLRAQPRIEVERGVILPDSARAVLFEIMERAGVHSARVTSAGRSVSGQVRAMYGYIQRHGVAQAHDLYGPEGDAVIDMYQQHRRESRGEILASMKAELERQLPAAFANKRLMHLNPCYYVFDISMRSIPTSKQAAFSRAAADHERVHRFLGKDEAEREAFHIEIQRPGECSASIR